MFGWNWLVLLYILKIFSSWIRMGRIPSSCMQMLSLWFLSKHSSYHSSGQVFSWQELNQRIFLRLTTGLKDLNIVILHSMFVWLTTYIWQNVCVNLYSLSLSISCQSCRLFKVKQTLKLILYLEGNDLAFPCTAF